MARSSQGILGYGKREWQNSCSGQKGHEVDAVHTIREWRGRPSNNDVGYFLNEQGVVYIVDPNVEELQRMQKFMKKCLAI
jgi:hypothetical protein